MVCTILNNATSLTSDNELVREMSYSDYQDYVQKKTLFPAKILCETELR